MSRVQSFPPCSPAIFCCCRRQRPVGDFFNQLHTHHGTNHYEHILLGNPSDKICQAAVSLLATRQRPKNNGTSWFEKNVALYSTNKTKQKRNKTKRSGEQKCQTRSFTDKSTYRVKSIWGEILRGRNKQVDFSTKGMCMHVGQ